MEKLILKCVTLVLFKRDVWHKKILSGLGVIAIILYVVGVTTTPNKVTVEVKAYPIPGMYSGTNNFGFSTSII